MLNGKTYKYDAKGWLSKISAGVTLGFTLALALSGLFAFITPGALHPDLGRVQFAMWLVAPLWVLGISLSFLFRSGLHAWMIFGLANVSAFGLLIALRTIAY